MFNSRKIFKTGLHRPRKKTALAVAAVLTLTSLSACMTPFNTWNSFNVSGTSDNTQDHTSTADHSGETTGTIGLKPGDSEDFNDFLMDIFNTQITSNSIDFHYSLEHPKTTVFPWMR